MTETGKIPEAFLQMK